MTVLSCEHVSMKYEKGFVVKDVTFTLEEGDYLCIVGENGSGKSTLMKGILGLVKPAEGKIAYHGIRPQEIGYLPQQTAVQKDFPASVMEVVLSGALSRARRLSLYTDRDRKLAESSAKYLGIENLRKKAYRDLSGGQQQRVLLARALCATEKILMLDEPVTGLDPAGTGEFYALLSRINREEKITIIMISHDIRSAVEYGNKILHMGKNQLFFGPTENYLETELCRRMMGVKEIGRGRCD